MNGNLNSKIKVTLAAFALAGTAAGCSSDASLIGDLCAAQGNSYEHCRCYVSLLEDRLNEDHLAMLGDMASTMLADSIDEDKARAALIERHGRYETAKFLATLASPQVEAELSCPE